MKYTNFNAKLTIKKKLKHENNKKCCPVFCCSKLLKNLVYVKEPKYDVLYPCYVLGRGGMTAIRVSSRLHKM